MALFTSMLSRFPDYLFELVCCVLFLLPSFVFITCSCSHLLTRNFTPKPMPLLEAQASNAAKATIDMMGSVIAIMTDTTQPVRLVAKYKPGESIA